MGQNRDIRRCRHCRATSNQNKAGKTIAGSQRYRCMHCNRKYTLVPKAQGYPVSLRKRASKLYVDGGNLRRIARQLKAQHRTVALWVSNHAEALLAARMPSEVKEAEMDELFTFIGAKKNKIYILTVVDRKTRCILDWAVVWVRTQEAIQLMIDDSPKSKWYYSDGYDA